MVNIVGSIVGMVGMYVIGVVLEVTGGNWSVVFYIIVVVYVLGVVMWLMMSMGECVFD